MVRNPETAYLVSNEEFDKQLEELGWSPGDMVTMAEMCIRDRSNDVLTELKNVVNITTLSMTDKERMDVVERLSLIHIYSFRQMFGQQSGHQSKRLKTGVCIQIVFQAHVRADG